MDPKDPSMLHTEVTGEMPLAHLYHLAHDPYNETSLSIEEISSLVEEHGWDHSVEATLKIYKRPESIQDQSTDAESIPVDETVTNVE